MKNTRITKMLAVAHVAAPCLVLAALMACATPGTTATTDGIPPATTKVFQEGRRDFTYEGQPIHPALIHLFNTDIADSSPNVVAVSVQDVESSNLTSAPIRVQNNRVFADSPDIDLAIHCSYQRLGVLSDGTQVIKSEWDGGGSSAFSNLLLLRFELTGWHSLDGTLEWQLVLRLVSFFPLGDHDNGVITVDGDRVIIGTSKYRPKEFILKNLANNPPPIQ